MNKRQKAMSQRVRENHWIWPIWILNSMLPSPNAPLPCAGQIARLAQGEVWELRTGPGANQGFLATACSGRVQNLWHWPTVAISCCSQGIFLARTSLKEQALYTWDRNPFDLKKDWSDTCGWFMLISKNLFESNNAIKVNSQSKWTRIIVPSTTSTGGEIPAPTKLQNMLLVDDCSWHCLPLFHGSIQRFYVGLVKRDKHRSKNNPFRHCPPMFGLVPSRLLSLGFFRW